MVLLSGHSPNATSVQIRTGLRVMRPSLRGDRQQCAVQISLASSNACTFNRPRPTQTF